MTPTHTSTISVLLEVFDKTEICTECGLRPGAVGGGF